MRLTRRFVKYASFTHSAVYLVLLVAWLIPGLAPVEAVFGLAHGLEVIALELSARFCADVFQDSYFGWDSTRYASRRAHNLVRAQSQVSLAESARGLRGEMEALVRRLG